MKKYEIVRVRYGEQQKYLDDGCEPFGVVALDTSYDFINTTINQRQTQHQSTEYIYLRRLLPHKET
jgi:hypothetical protein